MLQFYTDQLKNYIAMSPENLNGKFSKWKLSKFPDFLFLRLNSMSVKL